MSGFGKGTEHMERLMNHQTIENILQQHAGTLIPPTEHTSAIHWLTHLTFLPQEDPHISLF